MIARFADILNKLGVEPTAREIAEALFLAMQITPVATDVPAEGVRQGEDATESQRPSPSTDTSAETPLNVPQSRPEPARTPKPNELYLRQELSGTTRGGIGATGVRVASAIALPGARGIGKALRPLLRRHPSRTQQELDLDLTIQAMAETGVRMVVRRSAPERWLEAALVVDEGATARVWYPTVREFQRLLERHGAFRNVRVWGMNADDGKPRLYSRIGRVTPPARLRDPRELLDAEGRRVIFVLSDCHSEGWKNGKAFELMARWGESAPVLLVQLLPQRMWEPTAMPVVNARLRADEAGLPNARLQHNQPAKKGMMPMPVAMLEDWAIDSWAQMIAARGKASVKGFLIPRPWPRAKPEPEDAAFEKAAQDEFAKLSETEQARVRIADFKASASTTAFRLACYLAAVELNFPVMRLVQQAMMPGSRQSHLAEVLLGGLIRMASGSIASPTNPDEILYEFYPGIRELLLAPEENHTDPRETLRVVTEITRLIENRLPFASEFRALLTIEAHIEERIAPGRSAFATIFPVVTRRFFGGQVPEDTTSSGDQLRESGSIDSPTDSYPPLEAGAVKNDPWKGVFGGLSERNYRRLTAIVEPLPDSFDLFSLRLTVSSTDPVHHPLRGDLMFYFHPTFNQDKRVLSASKDGKEVICENLSWGAFTVGVETDDGATRLELDLAEQPDLPFEYRQPLRELLERAVTHNTDLMEDELPEFQSKVRDLQAACQANAPDGIIRYLSELGAAFSDLGDNRTAIEFYERALGAVHKFGDRAKEVEEISARLAQLRISKTADKPLRVYISYVHHDKELKDELITHLRVLERRGQVIIWEDRGIVSGPGWEDESGRPLDAEIESDFISEIQMQRLIERQRAGKVVIIPVILHPSAWSSSPFGGFQALPTNAKPITSWSNRDEAYRSVVEGLRRIVEKIRKDSHIPAEPIQTYDCFISYSQTDGAFARKLYSALERNGVRCWLDEKQLVPGDDIAQQIERGIRLYDKTLLCVSRSSLNSFWVEQEIQSSLRKEKDTGKQVLIPLLLDTSLLGKGAEGFFSQVGSLTFDDSGKLVDALLECDCMRTPSSRDQVISDLPMEISSRINRFPAASKDIVSIVSVCSHFQDGLKTLLQAVQFFEGGSLAWMRLEQIVRETLRKSNPVEYSTISRALEGAEPIDFRNWDRSEETFESQLGVVIERMGMFRLSSSGHQNDNDEAERYFKLAIETNPNNANNLGNYATFLSDHRRDYDEAERYYKLAIEADPNNASNLANYATFLENHRSDNDEAERVYQPASEVRQRAASALASIRSERGMSAIFYRNFDIQILRAGEEYLAQMESPDGGNASLNFTPPFSEDGLDALLSKLGPARRGRGVETPIEAAKRLGGQLYKAIFTDPIGNLLGRSIEAVARENGRLRIRLRLKSVPELANLPWEYLYDEQNDRFLALSYKTSIVRYLEVPQPLFPLLVKSPLRVLVIASSPSGYDQLGVDKEWGNLKTALSKMPSGLVEVERLESATLNALQERLISGEYHIFHYIGHCGFDPRTGMSVLVMEGDNRQTRFVDGHQLGVLLRHHPSLRIAILNACDGAVSNQNDVFTSVAQNLIRQEMPAVIAMRFEITDSVAIILAKAFYESLARGALVDTALAEARLAVFAADDGIELGAPVLYLRAHDGRLWDVEQLSTSVSQPAPNADAVPQTTGQKKPENLPPTEPSGTLSPSSSFYIEREADKKAMEMIAWPGITLSIKASGQTGASSLLRRLMEAARRAGKRVAHINFQQAFNDEDLTNSDDFHYRFCLALTHELDLEDRVTQYWEQYKRLSIGHRCTRYLRYLLQSLGPQPLTLAMDETDRLIDAGFRSSFFGLLRTWHNDRAVEGLFERMDLVLVTSLDPDQLIDDPKSGSPFNVGEFVTLNDFTPEEAGRLNHVYGAPLTARQIEQLMALIGGHPYLMQRAFHQIVTSNLTIDQVCGQSIQESGIFGRHLSSWFAFLRRNPFLKENLKKVLSRSEPDLNAFLSLRKLGLVRREGARTQFRCKLYEDYFREQFHSRRDP